MASLTPSEFDNPLGEGTGAAALFGATGGVMEAALRTAYEIAAGGGRHDVDVNPLQFSV